MTRWEFFKKHWVMSLIGAVILLAAVGTVIYAVSTGEGDEGFLKGKNGKSLTWAKSDLPVSCFYDDPVSDHLHWVNLARNQIQERVGYILSPCLPWVIKKPFPSKPPRGAILLRLGRPTPQDGVTVSSPWDAKHGGVTEIYSDGAGAIVGAAIYVDADIDTGLREVVWLHELLHSFGLGHDRLKSSIMYPTATYRPAELSARDAKRMRREYL